MWLLGTESSRQLLLEKKSSISKAAGRPTSVCSCGKADWPHFTRDSMPLRQVRDTTSWFVSSATLIDLRAAAAENSLASRSDLLVRTPFCSPYLPAQAATKCHGLAYSESVHDSH